MTCKFEKRKLTLYLFNELSPGEKDEIVNHLDSCHACQSELALLKSTVNYYASRQEIVPPSLKFGTTPRQENLARQQWTRKKARKLIPAFGLIALFVIMTISFLWFFRTSNNSNYWSLENSWEGPYRYHFEKIDRTIEKIRTDDFFN